MSRRLMLHVGQPKTGTTYLQALFTANRAHLARAGIHYPVYGDDARVVDTRRMVPCGNGRSVLVSAEELDAALRVAGDAPHVLFSSELMFNLVVENDGVDWIPDVARRHGFDEVRVLCLLRDPVPLAISEWQQRVKGAQGETRTLDEYLATAYDGPRRAVTAVERLRALAPYVDARFQRYESVVGREGGLQSAVAEWLGVPRETFAEQPREVVNRSLTRSEAELQRQLNLRLGRSGGLFGFRLTVDVPHVAPEAKDAPMAGREALQAAVTRLAPDVARLNDLLGPEESLVLDATTADDTGDVYRFTTDQLAALADGIAEHLEDQRRRSRPTQAARQRLRGLVRRVRRRRP